MGMALQDARLRNSRPGVRGLFFARCCSFPFDPDFYLLKSRFRHASGQLQNRCPWFGIRPADRSGHAICDLHLPHWRRWCGRSASKLALIGITASRRIGDRGYGGAAGGAAAAWARIGCHATRCIPLVPVSAPVVTTSLKEAHRSGSVNVTVSTRRDLVESDLHADSLEECQPPSNGSGSVAASIATPPTRDDSAFACRCRRGALLQPDDAALCWPADAAPPASEMSPFIRISASVPIAHRKPSSESDARRPAGWRFRLLPSVRSGLGAARSPAAVAAAIGRCSCRSSGRNRSRARAALSARESTASSLPRFCSTTKRSRRNDQYCRRHAPHERIDALPAVAAAGITPRGALSSAVRIRDDPAMNPRASATAAAHSDTL